MNINEHNSLPLKKRIMRIALAYLGGFTLFFLAGLIIITVNVRTREKVSIPLLVGKLYLEEHNNLISSGLRIELQKTNLVEYPYGYILAQSIAPGEIVSEGSRLILLTNDSKSVVPVPNVVGSSESIAQKILANIPVGKTSFSLSIGTITRIPNNKPAGEVIAQFPPEASAVIPETPVSILVSEGPDKLKTGYLFPDVKNVHVEIIKKMSYDNHIPFKIVTVKTYDYNKNGLVEDVDFGTAGAFVINKGDSGEMPVYTVHVKKYADQGEKIYRNELIWVGVDDFKLKGKAGTIFEKTTGGAAKYINPGYAVLDKQWPVYFQGNVTLNAWEGYQEKDKIISFDKSGDKNGIQHTVEREKVNADYTKKIKETKI
jgi:hypothetical protein